MIDPAPADPVFDYMTGQRNASQPALLEAFERESADAVAELRPALDIAYGPHPRQRYDLFLAPDAPATLVYLHAGYWQSRDKAPFAFLAPALVGRGLNVALVNYPLCPEVTLADLTEAVRHAVPAIVARVKPVQSETRLTAAGHSAGAHLAVELALTDWASRGERPDVIAAVVALSGVYDLEPLLETPLNDKLHLDTETARAASPIHRVRGGMPPGLFAVGRAETPAFQAQNADMAAAWKAAGNAATTLTVDGADHFSLLRSLGTSGGTVLESVWGLLDR